MRDVFSNTSKDQPRAKLSVYEPSLRDSHEFRDLMRRAVLALSALLTFAGFLNMVNRGEPHLLMWSSLGLTCVALIFTARLSSSSRHLFPMLHALMAVMVLNICVQVIHGRAEQLLWTLPFYLIWIMLLRTTVVATFGMITTLLTTLLAESHPIIPANYMLALSSALVVHFAKEQLRQHLRLAASDSLTGAFNRRYLVTQLTARRAEFVREARLSSLVLFDVDGLKDINDRCGHRVGDDLLRFVVKTIKERVRASDALFRIGGDEFALILGNAKAHVALNVANEIRCLLRDTKPRDLPDFSISWGVCAVDEPSSSDDWLERADEALYVVKEAGGDAARMAT